MTQARLVEWVRRTLEGLPGELQEVALIKAVGRPVVVWGTLTPDELRKIYASARIVGMVSELDG